MASWQPATCRDYEWVVADRELLGGKLAVRGTLPEVLRVASELTGSLPRG